MISTSSHNSPNPTKLKLWSVLFWLLVWQAASQKLGQPILLTSPALVLQRLFQLSFEADFWYSILFSLIRIALGFSCGVLAGTLLAVLSARFQRLSELLTPLILLGKTIPVASFIILVLIWIPSRNLSVFISFIMVLPIVYTNIQNGIRSMDLRLLEVAAVFRLPLWKRLRYLYLSQLMPFFLSAVSLSLGLCWKAGIAAEVIGVPDGSIGEKLYNAKVYLDTPDLFAWTLVIILISILFEKTILWLFGQLVHRLEQVRYPAKIEPDNRRELKSRVLPHKQPKARAHTDNTASALTIDHLNKSYHGQKVLCDLSFDFPYGSITAVMAPSGAGKTTLLRIFLGLETPDSGTASGLDNLKKSAVFQENRLCENLTALANIQLTAADTSVSDILLSMERIGLIDCAQKPVRELSGGMKRRISILRSLFAAYDLLLLDEPFKGLDTVTKESVINEVLQLSRGKTVIFITHDMNELAAMDCKQVLELPLLSQNSI